MQRNTIIFGTLLIEQFVEVFQSAVSSYLNIDSHNSVVPDDEQIWFLEPRFGDNLGLLYTSYASLAPTMV